MLCLQNLTAILLLFFTKIQQQFESVLISSVCIVSIFKPVPRLGKTYANLPGTDSVQHRIQVIRQLKQLFTIKFTREIKTKKNCFVSRSKVVSYVEINIETDTVYILHSFVHLHCGPLARISSRLRRFFYILLMKLIACSFFFFLVLMQLSETIFLLLKVKVTEEAHLSGTL